MTCKYRIERQLTGVLVSGTNNMSGCLISENTHYCTGKFTPNGFTSNR